MSLQLLLFLLFFSINCCQWYSGSMFVSGSWTKMRRKRGSQCLQALTVFPLGAGCWAGGVSTSAALTKHLSVSIPLADVFRCHRFFMREFSSAVVSMEAVFVCLCSELLLLSWLLLLSASSPLTQEGVAWHVKPQWCNNWQRIFMERQVFVEDCHASAAHILYPVLSTVSHRWCRTALTLNTQTYTVKLKQP